MSSNNKEPMILTQNRLDLLLGSRGARLRFYRQMLDRRLAEMETGNGVLQIPRLRGMRLRLSGKPFHATPELFFQEAGTTRFELPDRTLMSAPGSAVLIPSGMPHGEFWKGPGFLNVILMFQENGHSLNLGYLKAGLLRCAPLDLFYSNAHGPLLRYAEEMAAAKPGRAATHLRRGLYHACLARLRAGLDFCSQTNESNHPLLQRCLKLISVHFTRMDFSVIWLARELGCSPDHLSRLFRQETGGRLIQFIHQKRTEYASHLLRVSDMNIAETAWTCGFRQPSYFNRIFRAQTGLKPNQLRKTMLAEMNPSRMSTFEVRSNRKN
jgi:AraC-like DNA-binding protein